MKSDVPIILVQGPESARYWLRKIPPDQRNEKSWVVYDARAGQLFSEHGIPFKRESQYLDDSTGARRKQAEAVMFRWASDWYKDRSGKPKEGPSRPELFSFHELGRYFL